MRFVVWITTWMIHISYWYDGLALLKWVEYSLGKGGSAAQIVIYNSICINCDISDL